MPFAMMLVLAGACGRVSFGPVADNTTDALSGQADAMLGAFSAPTLISALSIPGTFDGDASLTGDRLEIYFISDRPGSLGGKDIWMSRRLSPTNPWPTPVLVPEVSSNATEEAPHVSLDGLTIWFASSRAGGQGSFDVWVSNRASIGATWSTPVVVSELNSPQFDSGVVVAPSGLVAYITTTRSGNADLYRATRATITDAWSGPVPVPELNTSAQDQNAFPSSDDRVMFLSSGDTSIQRLYMATRPATGAPFDVPVELTALNASSYDSDPCLADGLRYIVFSSSRAGDFDLYEASR